MLSLWPGLQLTVRLTGPKKVNSVRAAKLHNSKKMETQKTWHEKHHASLSFGGRVADAVANGMGSWKFIILQTVLVILWMGMNLVGFMFHWDAYPFIFHIAQSSFLNTGSLCSTYYHDVSKPAERT